MNYEHPFPSVSGYQRVCDIMEIDITEFRVNVIWCGSSNEITIRHVIKRDWIVCSNHEIRSKSMRSGLVGDNKDPSTSSYIYIYSLGTCIQNKRYFISMR